jgi:hypothetical protein
MHKEEYIYNWRVVMFGLVGCAVGLLLFLLCRHMWPVEPYHCADGWFSPSIGIRGACSHHGGVVGGDTMPWLMKWLCPIAGLWTVVSLSEKFGAYTVVVVGNYGSDEIGKRADIVDQAIQRQEGVNFLYKKKNEATSELRKIKPFRLFYLKPGITRTLCVEGYCYTRRDNRTFLIARMTDVHRVKA